MPRKLIIGCGRDWENGEHHKSIRKNSAYLAQEMQVHPHAIHPHDEYDTMDFDPKIKPTFLMDINDCESIQNKIAKGSYDLIVIERIPPCYMWPSISKSLDHLLSAEGLVIFVSCGGMRSFVPNICMSMRETDFKSYMIDETETAHLFFKCPPERVIEIFNYYINHDQYMRKCLLGHIMHHSHYGPVRFNQTNLNGSIHRINDFATSRELLWESKINQPYRGNKNTYFAATTPAEAECRIV